MLRFLSTLFAGVALPLSLIGLAGPASADASIDLIWGETGQGHINEPGTSSTIALRVILTAGPNGSVGAAVSVDYTEALGTFEVIGYASTPSAPLPILLGETTNTGSRIENTNSRRGEALGLRREGVDFERRQITIRRALTKGIAVTPKSGRARVLATPPTLAISLFELLAQRRRESIHRGWPSVPEWVFCSDVGTPIEERNITRSWDRLRRRAQKHGVRPLKLHTARHTFASLALAAGRSIRWVAEQLGHSNPELTLRVYAHAMPVDESDLAFADFGGPKSGAKRLYPAPGSEDDATDDNAPGASHRGRRDFLERETGFEPATLSLGKEDEPEEDQ